MSITLLMNDSLNLQLNAQWMVCVSVRDSAGLPSSAVTPVGTLYRPDGTDSPVDLVAVSRGVFLAHPTLDTPGRWTVTVDGVDIGSASATVWVSAPVSAAAYPTVQDVKAYIESVGDGNTSWDDADIEDALNAEAAAQRRVCSMPVDYPDDLRQALLRRVMRNLNLRSKPYAVIPGDENSDTTFLPGIDPEVRRFERGYPRLSVG